MANFETEIIISGKCSGHAFNVTFEDLWLALLIDSMWLLKGLIWKVESFRAIAHIIVTNNWFYQNRSWISAPQQIQNVDVNFLQWWHATEFFVGRLFVEIFSFYSDLTDELEAWLNLRGFFDGQVSHYWPIFGRPPPCTHINLNQGSKMKISKS